MYVRMYACMYVRMYVCMNVCRQDIVLFTASCTVFSDKFALKIKLLLLQRLLYSNLSIPFMSHIKCLFTA